jgi:hypothetical protein
LANDLDSFGGNPAVTAKPALEATSKLSARALRQPITDRTTKLLSASPASFPKMSCKRTRSC